MTGKLARLRQLKDVLGALEKQRGATPVDRDTAAQALTVVVSYLDAEGIKSTVLRELLAAFFTSNSPIFAPAKKGGGQSFTGVEESLAGKIAGIAYLKSFTNGNETRNAAKWVAAKLPAKLHKALGRSGRVTWRTIYAWQERWGGEFGDKGIGRDGYEFIIRAGTNGVSIKGGVAAGKLPGDRQLIATLNALANSPGL
jgi:hypothetical protein